MKFKYFSWFINFSSARILVCSRSARLSSTNFSSGLALPRAASQSLAYVAPYCTTKPKPNDFPLILLRACVRWKEIWKPPTSKARVHQYCFHRNCPPFVNISTISNHLNKKKLEKNTTMWKKWKQMCYGGSLKWNSCGIVDKNQRGVLN